jgi:hypothetical protein
MMHFDWESLLATQISGALQPAWQIPFISLANDVYCIRTRKMHANHKFFRMSLGCLCLWLLLCFACCAY